MSINLDISINAQMENAHAITQALELSKLKTTVQFTAVCPNCWSTGEKQKFTYTHDGEWQCERCAGSYTTAELKSHQPATSYTAATAEFYAGVVTVLAVAAQADSAHIFEETMRHLSPLEIFELLLHAAANDELELIGAHKYHYGIGEGISAGTPPNAIKWVQCEECAGHNITRPGHFIYCFECGAELPEVK